MKTLIKNGIIVDGSGQPSYTADLLIKDDKIEKIGFINDINADRVINAQGLVIAPGFIDTHSHSDLDVILRPKVMPKIMQGITTEFLGQDGVSMAPLPLKYISDWRKNIAGLDGVSDEIDWTYGTTDNYLKMIEKAQPGVNQCYLVPHGNIRMEAMGLDNRQPTDGEIERMRKITHREMEAGAFGLSTGLIYIPCAYSESKEIIEMCKIVAEYDGVFVIHQRSEADTIVDSMKEVIEIGRKSGVRVHWSHFKVAGKKNWGKIEVVLELLEQAKSEGITVSFDQYPYVAGSTMLGAILPPWVHDGGTNKVIQRLRDPEMRKKMRYDMENGIHGWDNFVDFAGFENIFVTSVITEKNKDAVGLSITQLAELRNLDPYTAVFDLLMEEENAVGMVDFYGLEDHVKLFMARPEMNACTDGLLAPGKPHPRLYGSFPRILGKYVREEKVITLEEAVKKLTFKAADAMNLKDRGLLKKGYFADITIFNPDTINDKGTFINPIQYPVGIEYVLVNGKVAVEYGKHTEILNGKVIRNKK
ncbi:MAG: D-aminoacylase [Epulopiscium sp.]|nr:D-aminoacylase [Candidatus Epulonipiscium sp.]